MTRRAFAALCLIVLLGACAPAATEPKSVQGVITKVGRDHIVLKTEKGTKLRMDNADTEITREHLIIHMKQKLPVSVTYDTNGDRLIARSIVDS